MLGSMRTTKSGWVILALVLGACGGEVRDEPEVAECEPATTGGEEGTADELSELMAEVLAPRICEQVIGSFIGLPGEDTHEGPAGGRDPAVGRWWVRECEARTNEGRLDVSFGGAGWTWIDRESMGFRVRQYLRFDASARFSASLHVGYDRRTRIATVWLRPAPGVTATVEPTGLVRAEATGFFSSMVGGLMDLTGNSVSTQAQTQATEEGSQRLQEKIQTGFSVTFELDAEQMDFMLGPLPRGVTPERPWDTNGTPWIVNERSSVWPGGMDVVGPVTEDAGAVSLEVELEDGDGAIIRRVCGDELYSWLDAAWSGRPTRPLRAAQVAELRAAHAPQQINLSALDCRALFVVTPLAASTRPSTLRYRVQSTEAVAAQEATTQPGTTTPATPATPATPTRPAAPTSVRVQIVSATVVGDNGEGSAWDMFDGDPDPYVVVHSTARGRELLRTPARDDAREPRFGVWLPRAVPIADLPLRFVVYDEDVAGDEVIGAAELQASQITGQATELTLDITSQGDRPRRAGILRIRLQP